MSLSYALRNDDLVEKSLHRVVSNWHIFEKGPVPLTTNGVLFETHTRCDSGGMNQVSHNLARATDHVGRRNRRT